MIEKIELSRPVGQPIKTLKAVYVTRPQPKQLFETQQTKQQIMQFLVQI